MSFAESELSDDRFLDGTLDIYQPVAGYRAATDPVFLAAAVPAKSGQSVLEIGCGAGTALACLLHRVRAEVTGLELQADYAELAERNISRNGFSANIVLGDLAEMPQELKAKNFDHVMMNPPFFESHRKTAPSDPGKSTAFIEGNASLHDWLSAGLKRLKPLGWITIIHKAERLGEILNGLSGAGDIHILPLSPRNGRAAGRVIVQARKGSAAPLKLLAPLVLHKGDYHSNDGDNFSEIISGILRDGNALVISGT